MAAEKKTSRNAKQWATIIRKNCKDAGTYQKQYDAVINTLADILEQRDNAKEQYVQSGGCAVISYTNKGGNTNPTKNPFLLTWDELNKTALQYWKELCLTPAAYRKATGAAVPTEVQSNPIAEALGSLELDEN